MDAKSCRAHHEIKENYARKTTASLVPSSRLDVARLRFSTLPEMLPAEDVGYMNAADCKEYRECACEDEDEHCMFCLRPKSEHTAEAVEEGEK
jgi:hypothetical protein